MKQFEQLAAASSYSLCSTGGSVHPYLSPLNKAVFKNSLGVLVFFCFTFTGETGSGERHSPSFVYR